MCTDERATPVSSVGEVQPHFTGSQTVSSAVDYETLSLVDAAGPLSSPSNIVPEGCSAARNLDSEVPSPSGEEVVQPHGNDFCHYPDTDADDLLFELECTTEPQHPIETVSAFHEHVAEPTENQPSRKRFEVPSRAKSSLHQTGNHRSTITYTPLLYSASCRTVGGKVRSTTGRVSRTLQLSPRERRSRLEPLATEGNYKQKDRVYRTGTGLVAPNKQTSWVRSRQHLKRNSVSKHSQSCQSASVRKLKKLSDDRGQSWRRFAYRSGRKRRAVSDPKSASVSSLSRYLPCGRCGRSVLRSAMWLHRRHCFRTCLTLQTGSLRSDVRPDSRSSDTGRDSRHASRDNIPNNRNVEDVVGLVLDGDDDRLHLVLTEDSLIRQYAALRMESSVQNSESSDDIFNLCHELRVLARLVLGCRRRNPTIDLRSLICPRLFNLVVATSRKLPASVVYILGRAVNVKVLDSMHHDDNGEARDAWNFRELFLLWCDSLAEDDSVLRTDVTRKKRRSSPRGNRDQPRSRASQQSDKAECGAGTQPDFEDNHCFSETDGLSDVFGDNPLQHVFADWSSTRQDTDSGPKQQINSTFPYSGSPNLESVVEVEVKDESMYDAASQASDVSDAESMSDGITGPQSTGTVARRMNSRSSGRSISPVREVGIRLSAGRTESYCCYCGKSERLIQRHWDREHSRERDVAELAASASGESHRRRFMLLRNLGSHRHNQKVLRDGRGRLLIGCRPNPGAKPADYSPCSSCWKYFTAQQLRQHQCRLRCPESSRRRRPKKKKIVANAEEMSKSGEVRKPDGIRIVSRKSFCRDSHNAYCHFCGSWKTKYIEKHWKQKHADEPEVAELASLGESDRAAEARYVVRLRNLGIHQHNVKVLTEGRGHLFVSRASESSQPGEYVPCEGCWLYVFRTNHSRHQRSCRGVAVSERGVNHLASSDALFLLPTPPVFLDRVSEVVDSMSDGDVKDAARSDPLITEFAAKLLSLGLASASVTAKTRLLARYLMEIRKQAEFGNATLRSCISTENFPRCVLAVNCLAGYDNASSSYEITSYPLKLRDILRQLSKLVKRDAIDRRDTDAVKDADHFAQLCMSQWKTPDSTAEDMYSEMEPDDTDHLSHSLLFDGSM